MKLVGTPLKRLLQTTPFVLLFVLVPFAGLALDVKDVPNPRKINGTWVTDMVGMLDEPTETQLNSMIAQLEQKNGTEIAVVTVPETQPAASPKEFATTLFNYWGIGKKGKNNGVLFLISKGDRRVEIETGYGIEPILPDAKVGNIIDTQVTPRFKQGDFNGGTLAGTKALVIALGTPQPSSGRQQSTPTARAPSTPQTSVAAQPLTLTPEPTEDTDIPWGLIGGGALTVLALGGGIATFKKNREVLLEPKGYSRFTNSNHVFLCSQCKKRMKKVDASILESRLSKPETVARQLGSVRFEGWECPECSQPLTEFPYHLVVYPSKSDRFSRCPNCQELTATRTKKTLKSATRYSAGKRLIIDECHCCSYRKEREETIPRLPPPPPPSSYSGGSTGGGSTGGGSFGGGSFGGGSSGGGGAGGGW